MQEQYEGSGGGGVGGCLVAPALGLVVRMGRWPLLSFYLVHHGMFIYLTSFSLQKIPAFTLLFFFFFFFLLIYSPQEHGEHLEDLCLFVLLPALALCWHPVLPQLQGPGGL